MYMFGFVWIPWDSFANTICQNKFYTKFYQYKLNLYVINENNTIN